MSSYNLFNTPKLFKHYATPSLLLVISIIPLVSLFVPGLPQTHDGQDHVARIANFYQSLTEGNIIPRWAGNLNWGYGHPVLMFLYPLSSYAASFFHFLGFSLIDSTKLVFGGAYVISAFTMFVWLRSFLGTRAALVGAISYILAPYRFVDLYVRGAIGEHVAFIFPPLICYFLQQISLGKNKFSVPLLGVSVAGLLLAHNAISLMFLPLFFLYGLYLFWQSPKKKIFFLKTLEAFIFGFILAAFFWMPAFFEGKYTLRDIVTQNEYASRFETIKRFFSSEWSYGGTGQFSVQVGLVQWLGVFGSPLVVVALLMRKRKEWILALTASLLFWITLFLMTKESLPLWQSITILQKFQFPWRFLSVSVFLTSLLVALAVFSFKTRLQIITGFTLVVLLLMANSSFWHSKSVSNFPDSFYESTYDGTTDTGESAPIWSVRFMEKRPEAFVQVIEGNGNIKITKRQSTLHEYEVKAVGSVRVVENTLYFPGWKVLANGKEMPLEFQDPRYRGLMTYNLSSGTYKVRTTFTQTKLRTVADMVSLVGFVLMGSYILYLLLEKQWRHFQ